MQGNMLMGPSGNLVIADLGAVETNIVVGQRTRAQQPLTCTDCHCPPEHFQGEPSSFQLPCYINSPTALLQDCCPCADVRGTMTTDVSYPYTGLAIGTV